MQKTGKKVYETGVLGEETGKTDAEKAFFVQVEEFYTILILNTIRKNKCFFALKTFAFRLHLQTVLQTPYIADYQIVSTTILCFYIFARKKCMGGRRAYIYIYNNQ